MQVSPPMGTSLSLCRVLKAQFDQVHCLMGEAGDLMNNRINGA